jgi:hypothetical protein
MSAPGGIMAVGSVAARRSLICCPHCLFPAIIRTSEQVTRTVKHLRLICTNETCGHTWSAQIAPVHTICPPAVPHPDVEIPPCPPEFLRHQRREMKRGDPPDPDQSFMFPDDVEAATHAV